MGRDMQDGLRRKLETKSDRELLGMVGSPQFARWAQELAVELLVARGHQLELPPPPAPPPSRALPVRKLLIVAGVAVGGGLLAAAYFAFAQHRRDEATRPLRQFAERLCAIASELPVPPHVTSPSDGGNGAPVETLGRACAAPLSKVDWKRVVGLVLMPKTVAMPAPAPRLANWTLVAARSGLEPSSIDDRALEPSSVDRLLRGGDDSHDSWSTRLPTPGELGAFEYVAISRVHDIVPPNITNVTFVGNPANNQLWATEEEVTVQGELGSGAVDVTIVQLASKAVVCSGRIEHVAPTGFSSAGFGKSDREARLDALTPQHVAAFSWVRLEGKLDRAWLTALCPTPWHDVCAAGGADEFFP